MKPDLLLMGFSALYAAITVAAVCYGLAASPPRSAERPSSVRSRRRSSLECLFLFEGYAALLWFGLPALGFGLGEGQVVAFLASALLAVVSAMSWLAAGIEDALGRRRR